MSKESDRRISTIASVFLAFLFSMMIFTPMTGGDVGAHHHHFYHSHSVSVSVAHSDIATTHT